MMGRFILMKSQEQIIVEDRPIRILPNGLPGVAYKRKVYELIDNIYINTLLYYDTTINIEYGTRNVTGFITG